MVRIFAAFLALAVLLGSSAFLLPPSSAMAQQFDEEDETLDSFVDEVVLAANVFWREVFVQTGKQWRDPKVVRARADRRVRSMCGNSRGADHSYCPFDETIFIDWDSDSETSFETLWDDERYFVIVTTIGHEYGHHVQHLLGLFADDLDDSYLGVQSELQADCLMGVFANAYRKSTDWVSRADLKDAIEDTHDAGDDEDTPASEMTHGTPEQRVEAYLTGFRARSLNACAVP